MWRLFSTIEASSLKQLSVEVSYSCRMIIELIATLSFQKLMLKHRHEAKFVFTQIILYKRFCEVLARCIKNLSKR